MTPCDPSFDPNDPTMTTCESPGPQGLGGVAGGFGGSKITKKKSSKFQKKCHNTQKA